MTEHYVPKKQWFVEIRSKMQENRFSQNFTYGDVKLGKGGCIVHSLDCNEDFVDLTKKVFQTNNIPFQEFSLDGCMTNTNPIKQSSSDCKNVLLSIPLRNMHTQVEVCDFRDLDSLIQGIYHTILKIEKPY